MNHPSPFGTPPPFGGSRPFDGSSLLDRFHGKPVGEVRFPTAAAPPRPAVDPDYLRKVRENDPWPEGSSCAPPSPKPLVPPVAVTLSNCRFLTPVDQLRFNESFEMAVDVRRFAPGKTRRAFFTLHYEMHHEGKTERGTAFQGTEGFPDSDRETHTVTAKGFLFIMAPLRTGATIDFWLTATHQEAAGPVESPKVNVPLLRHAHWMGGSDILFGLGSSFPRLGPDGRLASVLAAALRRGAKPADPKIPESVVCFGFASASGSPESNRKLSRRRAEAVKAILDRNHDAWHDLSRNHFGTQDIQAFLADLDTLEHLGCTPGPVDGVDGPRTRAAIEAFQRHANERWKLGLVEDGLCGPATWGAVLRALVACVQTELGQDPSQEPTWKPMPWGRKGEGVYANGEDFASEQEDPDERSVQIAFFAQGSEPRMEDHKGSSKASLKQNPTQDPAQVRKERIVLPPKTPAPALAAPPKPRSDTAGKSFPTAALAAKAALDAAFHATLNSHVDQKHRLEFGGWLYKMGPGDYRHTSLTIGQNIKDRSFVRLGAPPVIPKPYGIIGAFHSHPDNDAGLSGPDQGFVKDRHVRHVDGNPRTGSRLIRSIGVLVSNPNGTYGIGFWNTVNPFHDRLHSNPEFEDHSKPTTAIRTIARLEEILSKIGDPEDHD